MPSSLTLRGELAALRAEALVPEAAGAAGVPQDHCLRGDQMGPNPSPVEFVFNWTHTHTDMDEKLKLSSIQTDTNGVALGVLA